MSGPRHPQAILDDALRLIDPDAKTRQDLREEMYFALLAMAFELLPYEGPPERDDLAEAVKLAGGHPGVEEV